MNGEVVDFFEKFECLGEKCPDNCCKNWDMPVDAETLELYRNEKGLKKFRLNSLSICRNREGDTVLRTPFGRCCNLTSNGLCRLQCNGDVKLMPKVCRLFPRNTVSYGGYFYGLLDLSCIQAARMFMDKEDIPSLMQAPENGQVYWQIDEVYPEFVEDLRLDLDRILDHLYESAQNVDKEDEKSLWISEKDIFAHAYGMHLRLLRDDIEGARSIPFSYEYLKNDVGDTIPGGMEELYSGKNIKHPFFPMNFINELIYQNIPEDYIRLYHKKAGVIIRKYKKLFGKVNVSVADELMLAEWDGVCRKQEWLPEKMRDYFAYKLMMNYLNASIDYYVLEPVLLAMLNVQFLMVFIVTENGSGEEITKGKMAELISENEKLLSHNKVFNGEVMNKIRQEIF